MLQLRQVTSASDIATVRSLLLDYQRGLGVDLSFQDFQTEVRTLPGEYAPPGGSLLLALHDERPVGCVALRAAGGGRCEMKRLYVGAGTRGLGVGRALVQAVLDQARAIGYSQIVLDTLPSMADAQRLYEQFGFCDIPPYRMNPIAGTRYLGRSLAAE